MSKNNHKPKAKGSVGLKVLATTLVLSTIAGATAVCLTNDNVRATLGIGSVPLQSEVPQNNNNQNTNSSELQVQIDKLIDEKAEDLASIKLLESEKANIQSELDSYKASLDSEKELTTEQSLHIAELESAIADKENQINILNESVAEKDAQISNLQSIINDLQNRVDVLENQIGAVSNSVLERVNTYEMKYDTGNIIYANRVDKFVFLSSNNSLEVLNTETGEQKQLINEASTNIAKVGNNIYIVSTKSFAKFNQETMSADFTQLTGLNSNTKIGLDYSFTNEHGDLIFKLGSAFIIDPANEESETSAFFCSEYQEVDDIIYCIGGYETNLKAVYSINKTTGESLFITNNSVSSTAFSTLRVIGDYIFYDNTYSRTYGAMMYQISTGAYKNLSSSYAFSGAFEFDNEIFISLGGQFYRLNKETNSLSSNMGTITLNNGYEIIDHNNTTFLCASNGQGYIYNYETKMFTKTNLTASTYYGIKKIGDYVFDKTLSYVFNDDTQQFQLCVASANTNYDKYVFHDGVIVKTYIAKYFNPDTMMFEDFAKELPEYTNCSTNVYQVNGKLFCGGDTNASGSNTGVFYIDVESKTIKKVPDSGDSDILNTGSNFNRAIQVNDSYALLTSAKSDNYYAVLINTDTMLVENVFTGFNNEPFVYNGQIISANGNYIKVLDAETQEIKTIYSKESMSGMLVSYTDGDKVFFSTNNANKTITLDLSNYTVSYHYGSGDVDVAGLKLGYHSSSSTLYDHKTGDILNIKGLSSITLIDVEESVLFANATIVYEVMK